MFLTAALYKFVDLPHHASLQAGLQQCCVDNEVKGTLLLAREGINGTIAGPEDGIRRVLAYLRAMPEFADLVHKESWATLPPFSRMKVKLKKEIVTLRVPGLDPNKTVGQYVKPEDWNDNLFQSGRGETTLAEQKRFAHLGDITYDEMRVVHTELEGLTRIPSNLLED